MKRSYRFPKYSRSRTRTLPISVNVASSRFIAASTFGALVALLLAVVFLDSAGVFFGVDMGTEGPGDSGGSSFTAIALRVLRGILELPGRVIYTNYSRGDDLDMKLMENDGNKSEYNENQKSLKGGVCLDDE